MAQATDWISLVEGKQALNIDSAVTTFDGEIALYISAVSQKLDLLAGAAVIRTVTGEGVSVPTASSIISLVYRPVATVSSVTEYTGTTAQVLTAETNATKTAYNYLIDAEAGWLLRRSSGSDAYFPVGRGNVVVTYTAGRVAATANVTEKYKLAAAMFLSHLWRREQGAGTATFGGVVDFEAGVPTFGVPNVVRDLLAADIIPVLA
jgi:hypothetical protein